MEEPTAAEVDHFRARLSARLQSGWWISICNFGGLTLLFGYFAVSILSDGVGWAGILLAFLSLVFLALLAWSSTRRTIVPNKLAAFTLEGQAEQKTIAHEHRLLVGGVPMVIPEYWRDALDFNTVLRVRVVGPLDKSNKITMSNSHPLQLVAIEGGPSIEFEHTCVSDRWPNWNYGFIHGIVYSGFIGLVLLGGTVSHLNSPYGSWADTMAALPALASKPLIVFDGDALHEADAKLGLVSVQQGWVLPHQLVEHMDSNARRILITDKARNRLITDREDLARVWQEAWKTYETALDNFEKTPPVKPEFAVVDGKLLIVNTSNLPTRPQQPKLLKVMLNPDEVVALEMNAPRGNHVSLKLDSIEPVMANLEQRTEFSGISLTGGDTFPVRLQSKTLVYEHLLEGLALLAGLFASAFALLFLSRLLRTRRAQQAFKSRLRTAYAHIGVTL